MSFRSAMDRMRSVILVDLQAVGRVQSFLTTYLTLFSPVAITIVAGVAPNVDNPYAIILWTLTGVFFILHILLWFLLQRVNGPVESAALAMELQASYDDDMAINMRRIVELENELMEIDKILQLATNYISYTDVWNAVLAQALSNPNFDEDALRSSALAIFTPISLSLEKLFGIHEGEQWCLTFYAPAGHGNFLKCVWGCRAAVIEDGVPHRNIPIGSGHIGQAFSRGQPLVHPDMQDASVRQLFLLEDAHRRDYDASRYRALASYPVRFSGQDTVLGVIAITSDMPGRFTEANAVPLRMAATYAGMLLHLTKRPNSFQSAVN